MFIKINGRKKYTMSQRSEYEFKYYNPAGKYLFSITNWHGVNFWVSEKEVGSFYIDVPYTIANHIMKTIEIDGIFEIYRSYIGGSQELMFGKRWFVRLWRDKIDENGVRYTRILCVGCNNLIDRRIIYYKPNTAQVEVSSTPADDAIKRLARENFGADCTDASRDWSDKITITPNVGEAPNIDLDGLQYRKLLPLFGEICDLSYDTDETYLTFDLKWSVANNKYIFDTFVGQMGANKGVKSQTPLYLTSYIDDKFSEFGGLSYASIEFDATDTRTFVVCGGQGEGDDRVIKEASNDVEIERVPFGLWEDWQDARQSTTEAAVQSEADATLLRWTPRIAVNGHISSEFARHLGTEINWGDKVIFKFKDSVYDVNLYKIQVALTDNGAENISIFTRNMKEEYY